MTDYRKILMLRSMGCSQREMERNKIASRKMNCTPFIRQYGILFRKWGVFVCQRDNESTTERRRWKSLNESTEKT